MIETIETSKTIDPEHSLSFEGVGRNKTITESVRLEIVFFLGSTKRY